MKAVPDVGRDWVELTPPKNEAGGCTHHGLQLNEQTITNSSQQAVAIVKPAGDERMN
jgi:hypothetical protein